MKKTQKLDMLPPGEPSSWLDSLEENPFIHWVVDHGKSLLYLFVGLIFLTILIFRFFQSGQVSSETDFINGEKEFQLFAAPLEGNDPAIQANALKNLEKILSVHPELHAKYDGSIAEILLTREENSKAIEFATPAIKRTSEENDPFYSGYAKASLLIADNKYDEALKAAKSLKDQMTQQGEEYQDTPEKFQFGTLLYALNLLRIGMLQQKLALHQEELKSWQEWKNLLHKSREGSQPKYIDGQMFITLESLLSEGEVSFTNYIEAREKILKN